MAIFIKSIIFSMVLMLSISVQAQDNAPLPDFKFTDTNGKEVSSNTLEKGIPVIIFYFDPYCDHCEQQALWIKETIVQFKDVTMIWVSWGEDEDIEQFKTKYFGEADSKNRVIFCKDADYNLDSWFGYSEVPSVYVYNKNWLRTASFTKETSAQEILDALKK